MTGVNHNVRAIRDALALLLAPGQVIELRVLGAGGRSNNTASGYFNDLDKAAQAAARYNGHAAVYMTLQEVNPALFARAANRVQEYVKATTTDTDIISRHWLLVDADATRAAGISANDEEHVAALQRIYDVRAALQKEGWPDPILADSGNGGHALYAVTLPADDGGLTQRVLAALAARFDDDRVKIDRSVHNPSRISKVYGTFACKGDNIAYRPHRLAHIIETPEVMTAVPVNLLEAVAGGMPKRPDKTPNPNGKPRSNDLFNVEAYLREHGVTFSDPVDYNGGKKWKLDACVWAGHSDKSAIVTQKADGTIGANCNHNSCEGLGWLDLREHFEPGYKAKKAAQERAYQERRDAERPAVDPETGEIIARRPLTDLGNAERLVDRFGENLRYVVERQGWISWQATHWAADDTGDVYRYAKEAVRGIYGEAAHEASDAVREATGKHATRSEATARIEAMVKSASREKGMPIRLAECDTDLFALNVLNGTVNLRTGELRPHRREDFIAKIAPVVYDPDARLDLFDAFLARVLPHEELRDFVQRAVGYSLTGDTGEETLFFPYGPAATGKSTLLAGVCAALGDYAGTADFETFLARDFSTGGPRNDVARLAGKRFVVSLEVDQGKRLAEGLVKSFTGGDVISARFLHKEAFEFKPEAKLWLAANHRPIVDEGDEAMWRRIDQIPFSVQIPVEERDPRVKATLRDPAVAGPAILAWAVRGCLAWQREGLLVPEEVNKATAAYRAEMDTLSSFIEDRCEIRKNAWVAAGLLYRAYKQWCQAAGELAESQQAFGRRLTDRGYHEGKQAGVRGRFGLALDGSAGTRPFDEDE